jgi:DNA (cytosine-5)-methyltransferase 1
MSDHQRRELRTSVSLFGGGGIGDIGFRRAGFRTVVLNELSEDRAQLAKLNFPEANVIVGDIWDVLDDVETATRDALKLLGQEELYLLSATPPCQGMSKNGIGSILKAMRDGKRSTLDHRNYLFEPALDLVNRLKPRFFFFENVDRMANAYVLDSEGQRTELVDLLRRKLGSIGYLGDFWPVNMADYGVPQHRRRLVGIFVRQDYATRHGIFASSLMPDPTIEQRTTLRAAIGHLPEIDSSSHDLARCKHHPLHHVPVSRPDLYRWIRHTKEGDTAFNNNRCVDCGFVSGRKTVRCDGCGVVLAKPVVVDSNGEVRLIKGFVSAYKRMSYDEPSATITTRSAYACSDHNLHPTQHRVLSLLEIAILQGIQPEEYKWGPFASRRHGKNVTRLMANDTLLRDVLGEPVPPPFSEAVATHLVSLIAGINQPRQKLHEQLALLKSAHGNSAATAQLI